MELRLFPLRTVLFPGMELPLQVFEERYRQLIAECRAASEPFGVALIREGEEAGGDATPYDIGTTARIQSWIPGPAGRTQLRAIGERRFRILALHRDRPYLRADVDYPVDEGGELPPALVDQVRTRYLSLARLRLTAAGAYERAPALPTSPGALADAAASTLAAPPEQLQRLLETVDVRRRLEGVRDLLDPAVEAAHRDTARAVALRYASHGRLS